MAIEQSINLDSKTTVGIIGISQRPRAQARWFLACHERAAITTAIPCCCTLMCEINNIIMRDMYALQDSDRVVTHREAEPRRMLRDHDDVRKLLTVITSGLITDPFSLNEEDNEISPNADRELFGRLVFAAKSRDINLKDVLSYELSAVPFSLADTDGSLMETNKSVFMAELDKKVDVQLKLPQVTTSTIYIAHIFDDMALVHGASTLIKWH